MPNRTALFVRKASGGMFSVEDLDDHPGNVWFVDSGQTTTGGDTVGHGRNPDEPFLTLDYAVGQCTANNGDVIYVMPGHSETRSVTGAQVTLDVVGVRIRGLGDGSDRPTFTFSHTGATWTWSAANVSIENLLLVTGIDSVVTYATISGADAKIINCETRDTTDIEVITDFTCTGDRLVVDGLFKNGYTGGNANDAVLAMNGVNRAEIMNCRLITNAATAIIEFVTTACTAIEIHDCDFLETGTTDYSKNVVDTITGSTWSCWNVFDMGAGASFSGGSGAALAGDDISAVQTNLTSSCTSVGTAVASIQTNLTSSATSVTTHVTSVGTAVDSIQTNLTSSATSVGTGVASIQTNLTSSATSVGTGVASIQTNLTSSATSIGTLTTSVGTQESTNRGYLASEWTSWESEWSVQLSHIRSGVESL